MKINAQECGVYFSDYNVSFDLSPLTLLNGASSDWYKVSDNNGVYEYYFNLCEVTNAFPNDETCTPSSETCILYGKNQWNDTICDELYNRSTNAEAYAFQIDTTDNDKCYRLGGDGI